MSVRNTVTLYDNAVKGMQSDDFINRQFTSSEKMLHSVESCKWNSSIGYFTRISKRQLNDSEIRYRVREGEKDRQRETHFADLKTTCYSITCFSLEAAASIRFPMTNSCLSECPPSFTDKKGNRIASNHSPYYSQWCCIFLKVGCRLSIRKSLFKTFRC